jgi:hypothetical protein
LSGGEAIAQAEELAKITTATSGRSNQLCNFMSSLRFKPVTQGILPRLNIGVVLDGASHLLGAPVPLGDFLGLVQHDDPPGLFC